MKKIALILAVLLLASFVVASDANICGTYDFDCDGVITLNDSEIINQYWRDGTPITINIVTGTGCNNLTNYLAPFWQDGERAISINDATGVSAQIANCIPEIPCTQEGQSMPVYPGYACCSGLVAINPQTTQEPLLGASICSKCGNGVCEQWENQYNCPSDCGESNWVKEQVKCVFYNSTESQTCYTSSGYNRYSCNTQADSSGQSTCVMDINGENGDKLEWKSSCGGYATTYIDGINEYAEFKCDSQGEVSENVTCVIWNAKGGEECYSSKGSCNISLPTTSYSVSQNSNTMTSVMDKIPSYGKCSVDVKGNQGETVTWKSDCGGYAYTVMDGSNERAEFTCASEDSSCVCTMDYTPVCGKNGKTYGNACAAKCAKVDVAYQGECQSTQESYKKAKWTCSNGQSFLEESDTCKPYSYWKDLARRKCASLDTTSCYTTNSTVTTNNNIVISSGGTNSNSGNAPSISGAVDFNEEVTVCRQEVVTDFSVGDKCETNCEKYNRSDGCTVTKCTDGNLVTESIYCPQQNCNNQGIEEIKTIKEKCYVDGGEVIIAQTTNGCNDYQCAFNTQNCLKPEDISSEKIISCNENGGELLTKVDSNGCIVVMQCAGEVQVEDTNAIINPMIINDQVKLLELALKLESLRIELQKTTQKVKAMADYYNETGDLNSAMNFDEAVNLLEDAVIKVDNVKQYIKDNVADFSEEDAQYVISVISTIRNEILTDVLMAILG